MALFLLIAFAGLAVGFLLGRMFRKEDKQAAVLIAENSSLQQQNFRLQTENREAIGKAAALEAKNEMLGENMVQMQDQMKLQFEQLSRQVLEENAKRFSEQSEKGLSDLLNPLRERLNEFQSKVDKSFGEQAKEQFALKNEIERIVKVSQTMSTQTDNLTKALKGDVKAQGNWGEVMLERILEASGLRPGLDYFTQAEFKNAEGQSQRPDIIVNLPESRHIVIDSKVSLTHYERYASEENAETRETFFRQFMDSVRNHVRALSDKRYQQLAQLDTPDFVLMFMPIEGAYALAMQEDPQLHSFAWERKIVLVCPSTLFATLRTIASIWRLELQNQNALKIAQESGLLYDKFVGFVEDLQGIGKQIERTQGVYQEAFGKLKSGRGNLIRKAEQLKTMGAKTAKSLPLELVLSAEEEESV